MGFVKDTRFKYSLMFTGVIMILVGLGIDFMVFKSPPTREINWGRLIILAGAVIALLGRIIKRRDPE